MTEPTNQTNPTPPTAPPTSTGLQENIASLLCYILGWVTGIVFLILEPKNKTVKFHAIQSILVFGALSVIGAFLGWIPFVGTFFIAPLVGIVGFISWVVLMIKASQGGKWKYPIAGNYAEKWAV
jgi:uncharacterized membrane protein